MPSGDPWDFYRCIVDDAPASIFVNFAHENDAPIAGLDTLYWMWIDMREPDDHEMGTADEGEALCAAENAIGARAEAAGFRWAGRLRNLGVWQLVFYGAPEQLQVLTREEHAPELDGRSARARCKLDATWSYYREFLLPNAERRRWMADGRVVEVLERSGDTLVTPREVDHWAYFSTAAARDAYVSDAVGGGFARRATWDDDKRSQPFGAQMYRVDAVEHDVIHDAVMELYELAEQHGGTYDGWETPVIKRNDT